MLHAYCVRFAGQRPPDADLRGVGGAPVSSLAADGLAIWVSESQPARTTADRLLEHDRVVRRALRSATPLPLRFGTTFSDEKQATELLRVRHDTMHDQLTRIAGQVEMGLRVTLSGVLETERAGQFEEVPLSGVSPGRAHLESRRRLIQVTDRTRADLDEALGSIETALSDLGLETVRSILAADPPVGTLAQLVRRDDLLSYRRRVESLEAPDARIVISGPWAPYSFVS